MTRTEQLRAYIPEPVAAALLLSLSANLLGKASLADFMHTEAHDVLSLATVLLGASLALWIGLFWISSTAFGQWLSSRMVLDAINTAYITSIVVLLMACIGCIFCAYVAPTHAYVQMTGIFLSLYALATIPTMLNNTHKLLQLHGLFGRQGSKVTDMRSAASK